ncbi:MAG TPA: response regulator transcription factor [Gemmatimonadaceae bacterium]|nr:response regulator transcription factor [Gemmatimonadaceae bacterium]
MRRTILVYGVVSAALALALKFVEYRFLVVEHSLELYGGLVALLFASLGIWLGLKLSRPVERVVVREVVVVETSAPFSVNAASVARLGVTPRELEILGLITEGLSTREISERLYVSENTVKTHSSRLFAKLGARRRTQAVQLAKEAGLVP